jgi:plastocyanin
MRVPARTAWAGTAVVVLVAACSGGGADRTEAQPSTPAPSALPTAGPVVAPPTSAPAPRTASTSAPPGAQVVNIAAVADAYDPPVLRVHPGAVHINLRNVDVETHNIVVPAVSGAKTADVTSDQTGGLDVVLRTKGRYDFFCTYHRLYGMQGVIVVE